MADSLTIACVQTCATPDAASNVARAEGLIRQARAQGARFVALPEAVDFIDDGAPKFARHADRDAPAGLARLQTVAGELGVWLLIGSLSMRDGPKLVNRSFLVDDAGRVAASYDKIHLFDVTLPTGESHRESEVYEAGHHAVLSDTPWGAAGLSICYDLRFPQLYRALAQAGAKLLFIPAAFTETTGRLHWHTLVRARAIETGCYVVAPAQCGTHVGDRRSFGHSLIVDPWGHVLADGGTDTGVIAATIDLREVDRYRAAIPSPLLEQRFDVRHTELASAA